MRRRKGNAETRRGGAATKKNWPQKGTKGLARRSRATKERARESLRMTRMQNAFYSCHSRANSAVRIPAQKSKKVIHCSIKGLLTSIARPTCRAGRTTDCADGTDGKWRGSAWVRPLSFESNPSVKSVKSVVKTIFESGTAIELARAAIEWSTTGGGSEKSTQDAMTLKVGTAEGCLRRFEIRSRKVGAALAFL